MVAPARSVPGESPGESVPPEFTASVPTVPSPASVAPVPTVTSEEPTAAVPCTESVTVSASVSGAVSPEAKPVIRSVPAPPIVIPVPAAVTSPANVVSLSTTRRMSPVAPDAEKVEMGPAKVIALPASRDRPVARPPIERPLANDKACVASIVPLLKNTGSDPRAVSLAATTVPPLTGVAPCVPIRIRASAELSPASTSRPAPALSMIPLPVRLPASSSVPPLATVTVRPVAPRSRVPSTRAVPLPAVAEMLPAVLPKPASASVPVLVSVSPERAAVADVVSVVPGAMSRIAPPESVRPPMSSAAVDRRAPPVNEIVLPTSPSGSAAATDKVPAPIRRPPVSVLAPPSTSVPRPAFVRPSVPATLESIVALTPSSTVRSRSDPERVSVPPVTV